ncbi:hypothetical protein JCM19000A_37060 [Silvimonas sp. JCM 19000]
MNPRPPVQWPAMGDINAWHAWLQQRLAQAQQQAAGDMSDHHGQRPAAVLIALVPYPDGTRIILTERSHALSNHAGQISFPGGRIDPEDADAAAAAIREAWEEIALPPASVQVVGQLGRYHTITGFVITPIVAVVTPGAALAAAPSEVAAIFELPVQTLLDPTRFQRRWIERRGVRGRTLFIESEGVVVWGATAGMLMLLARALGVGGEPQDQTAS